MEKTVGSLILLILGIYWFWLAIKTTRGFFKGYGVFWPTHPLWEDKHRAKFTETLVKTDSKFNRGIALIMGLLGYPLFGLFFLYWAFLLIAGK